MIDKQEELNKIHTVEVVAYYGANIWRIVQNTRLKNNVADLFAWLEGT